MNRLWWSINLVAAIGSRFTDKYSLLFGVYTVVLIVTWIRYHLHEQLRVVSEELHTLSPPAALLFFIIIETHSGWLLTNQLYGVFLRFDIVTALIVIVEIRFSSVQFVPVLLCLELVGKEPLRIPNVPDDLSVVDLALPALQLLVSKIFELVHNAVDAVLVNETL